MPRYSEARGRELHRWEAALERFAASKPGGWLFVNVFYRLDRRLLPLTDGRVSVGLGQPVGLLETTGAKSGATRRTPLVYAPDGDNVILVASKAGDAKHPAWYHNLKAHPNVAFLAPRRRGRYVARELEGPERDAAWERAVDVYSGYRVYQERAGARRIPVILLEPLGAADQATD